MVRLIDCFTEIRSGLNLTLLDLMLVHLYYILEENIPTNPTPYPTVIKKEVDHLHITSPLNIYPEGNYELDDLGLSGNFDLKFDGNNGTDANVTVDNAGGWYLVRQANEVTSSLYTQFFFIWIIFIFVPFHVAPIENGATDPSWTFTEKCLYQTGLSERAT